MIFAVGFTDKRNKYHSGRVILNADSKRDARTKATKFLKEAWISFPFRLGRATELNPDEYDVLAVCECYE